MQCFQFIGLHLGYILCTRFSDLVCRGFLNKTRVFRIRTEEPSHSSANWEIQDQDAGVSVREQDLSLACGVFPRGPQREL